MSKPINTLPFIERLVRSYYPCKASVPTLNVLMIKSVGVLYELHLAGKPILFKQATYDTLKRIVGGTTEMHELNELDSEKVDYCLMVMTMDCLAALKSFVVIESRKHMIDKILPTL